MSFARKLGPHRHTLRRAGLCPDGAYGDGDQAAGRACRSNRARSTRNRPHPFVGAPETGTKALFSSAAYIQSFEGMSLEDSQALAWSCMSIRRRRSSSTATNGKKTCWSSGTIGLCSLATGGFDGYDRLLHRVTIADTSGELPKSRCKGVLNDEHR